MPNTFANSPQFEFNGTLTFAEVADSDTAFTEQTVTLPTGVKFPNTNGVLIMVLPALDAGLAFNNVFAVSATTFKVRFFNNTSAAVTPVGTSAKLVML